jgi:membrane protease YdiL (CAAX protease family)
MNPRMTIAESSPAQTAVASGPSGAPSKAPRVWKLWGTLAWSFVLYCVMAISATFAVVAAASWYGIDLAALGKDQSAFLSNGVVVAALSISGVAPILLTIALATRLARQGFRDYLAIRWASARYVWAGLLASIGLVLIGHAVALAANAMGASASSAMAEGIRSAHDHDVLALYAIAVVITGPVTEEAVFRGFVYRGFAASKLGPIGAVVLSSLMFTAMHVQYDLIRLGGIMISGLILGTMRAVSGSTLLTTLMHSIFNGVVLLEALWLAGLLG